MSTNATDNIYDFIIVGSGAGGAPLAARLVQAGKRVLVIEAGPDHGLGDANSPANEVTRVPAFHGLSTEHPDISWRFFVNHFRTSEKGQLPDGIPADSKMHVSQDPQEQGIFYPRATGVGGCTIHNAMITIAGPDSDWDDLADELDDPSWRGQAMRGYFQRFEHNDYQTPPPREPTSTLGMYLRFIVSSFWWLLGYTPDSTGGKHGFRGWLHTSTADISLGLHDKQLIKMLKAALWQSRQAGLGRAWTWLTRFFKGEVRTALDPNHYRTSSESPEGVVMIPVAVYGRSTTVHQNRQTPYAMLGRRSSPRELLHETLATHRDKLTIWTNCLVTKLILSDDERPRALGVQFLRGEKLYRAHENPSTEEGERGEVRVRDGGEVILAGGAFNTPQLLMLSGIGPAQQLAKFDIPVRVDLPGVGQNLQDRYEVSVVGQMKKKFELWKHATLKLPTGDAGPDPHLRQWREEGTGLYTSNGAILGIFKRSRPELPKPDLFMFGVPLEFRGYAVNYSVVKNYDRFSWIVLKSHTQNRDGEVTLRSTDPRDRPHINFHYFNTRFADNQSELDPDLESIVTGVRFIRGIYRWAGKRLVQEIHPALPESDNDALKRWIRSEAWGHHACGTCRMGRSGDAGAVLDSQFRVRKVDGLRVVDASIFPRIPGYFIVTNIYMASEKAADTILGSGSNQSPDAPTYPQEMLDLESKAIHQRRELLVSPNEKLVPVVSDGEWDESVAGIGLSGGGIRSATFSLGIIQCLARDKLLRKIDFMSTVSGGGYIGACLGRFYDRLRSQSGMNSTGEGVQAAQRVEAAFTSNTSHLLDWLRKHGNYIAPQGSGDGRSNFAVFVRNLLSIHLVVGLLLFSVFGVANYVRYVIFEHGFSAVGLAIDRTHFPIGHLIAVALGPWFSPWFILFELLLLFLVLPRIAGYWIVSQDEHESFKKTPLAVMFIFVATLIGMGVGHRMVEPILIGFGLLSSLIQVEMAWMRGSLREAEMGTGGIETQRQRTRNYLTYDLGLGLALSGVALGFALIDTLGHGLQQAQLGDNEGYARAFSMLGAAIVAALPLARWIAGILAVDRTKPTVSISRILKRDMFAGALAIVLFTLPLVFYSFASHAVFDGGLQIGRGVAATLFALAVTAFFALPTSITFVNRSSLAQTYSARLARAYLGASNPLRNRPDGANIAEVIPGDDVATIKDYRPHEASGPLHIINVTINQTLDSGSRLRKRDRQGEIMAVSGLGFSIGERWHCRWDSSESETGVRRRIVPLGFKQGDDHPLVNQQGTAANRVEALSLRQWIGISGAAVDPGRGRTTRMGTALLMGLVNLRTGYWWDSGIPGVSRTGFPQLSFVRKLLYLFMRVFATQCLVLFEWIARYPGPWERFWHLSDGGFFENTGGYELVRRRLPRIIICDGSADPTFGFESLADLVRKVRIDFDATIVSFTNEELNKHLKNGERQFVGTIDELRPQSSADRSSATTIPKHAALFWIHYAGPRCRRGVLLYIKASLSGDESIDVRHYAKEHPDFPHESTVDQFFDEAQWESYRQLGEHVASPLTNTDWFWKISLED